MEEFADSWYKLGVACSLTGRAFCDLMEAMRQGSVYAVGGGDCAATPHI